MKAFRTLLGIAIFMVVGPHPCLHAEIADGILAVVHDSIVTFQEVELMNMQTIEELRRQYAGQPELYQKKLTEMQNANLDQLVSRQLILHEFKTAGYNLPDTVIDELVQEQIKARYHDRMTLTKTLQEQGITYEKFRQGVRDRFIIEALRQKNIASEIIISPHKVETYYQEHRESAEFKVDDEVKLRMIVLKKALDPDAPQPRKLAEDIVEDLKAGASFPEMAALYSQGSQKAGDWGWVEKKVLRKELADVAFGLKPGQHSGAIEMPEGDCYLLLVEDARTAHYKPLPEVRDQIERNLILEERTRLEKKWIDKLQKKTFVNKLF
jgi:peptidyl-prolyl cis-trans isomerase SurA